MGSLGIFPWQTAYRVLSLEVLPQFCACVLQTGRIYSKGGNVAVEVLIVCFKGPVVRVENPGLCKPTPVQQHCIPPILSGQDCIGCAQTGSGKTLAFALPILQALCQDPFGIFALVLTPTRELAFQIADQFRVLGKPVNLQDCVVVGGLDMVTQGQELSEYPHLVVATPGRLADHLETCNTFSLKKIRFLVLDEADRLLEGHFDEQLQTIFSALPKKRQTLLFSATITQTLEELKRVTMTNKPFVWSAQSAQMRGLPMVEELDHRYVLAPAHVKDSYLVHILERFIQKQPNGSAIIFVPTCRMCQLLSMALRSLSFSCTCLHSMASQMERMAALSHFKSNKTRILVATDVASRGLDIPQVELVLNQNMPSAATDYVHRVGRTARAGRGGTAITLVTQYDIKLLHAVEKLIGTKLKLHETSEKSVLKILTQVSVALREAEIRLDEMDFGQKRSINKRKKLILKGLDPDNSKPRKTNFTPKEKKKKMKKGL